MKLKLLINGCLSLALLSTVIAPVHAQGDISGETNADGSIKKWHRIELVLDGPNLAEAPATFRNYRLDVSFVSPSGRIFEVPGFFDGDGNPATSGATSGNKWKARFSAGEQGTWNYSVSFRTGTNIAANLTGGSAGTSPDGQNGSFRIGPQDKSGKDFRAKGKLEYVGEHYLQFANGEYFIKAGANSPEVFLADQDFDGGVGNVDHSSQISNWNTGDPTWGSNKGKGIVGTVNYLSDRGVNSHYFLTMNIFGDGKRSYPYVDDDSPYTFDISKLAQWEMVFSQFDKKGLMLHFVTQETENMQFFEDLEGGFNATEFSVARKIYYRELVARFGHHLAITWNIGEENNANFSASDDQNTADQRRNFADRLQALTYYNENITIHNGGSGQGTAIDLYQSGGLLGDTNFTGTSLQLNFSANNHDNVRYWYDQSAAAGKKWVIAFDEAFAGNTSNVDTLRKGVIWSSLMAGGQVEWYIGGGSSGDLDIDLDYSSFEAQWATLGLAANFMNSNFATTIHKMIPNDALITNGNYAMADLGNTYLFYLTDGGNATVDLSAGSGSIFTVQWFNPSTGDLVTRSNVNGGSSSTNLGSAPNNTSNDWVIKVAKTGVGGNSPPSISFSAPAVDSSFSAPASPIVELDASDTDGSVTSVELFVNNMSVGQDVNSPYRFNDSPQIAELSNLPAGSYSLRALATDNDGDTSTVERTFTVTGSNGNVPPAVSFNSPTDGMNFTSPASLAVSVSASDSDGSITSVDLYMNGAFIRQERQAPYEWNDVDQDDELANLSNGLYTLRAVATDNDGDTSFIEIMFSVSNPNQAPSVSFTRPSSGSNLLAPAAVMVTVLASDSDGTIAAVDLYLDNVFIRRETSSPYQWNQSNQSDNLLKNLAVGTYTLRAVAFDDDGATSATLRTFKVRAGDISSGVEKFIPSIYLLLDDD